MRITAVFFIFALVSPAGADDLESRVLTHYLPQDFLERVVRTQGWTEIPLDLKGGTRNGDTVRIWAGGSVDHGQSDQPGINVSPPSGSGKVEAANATQLTLSKDAGHAFAILCKTDSDGFKKCLPAGKPLEMGLTKDKERIWIGFNDLNGQYHDNHLGKGGHHEFDPLWIRIEVVRKITD